MINRILADNIKKQLFQSKAIILMGCRQIGKTTLLEKLFKNDEATLWLNGDDFDVRAMFDKPSADRLRSLIGNKKVIIIDEAQRITDIGVKLKLITDQIKDVQLIATGSSSFDLSNEINEPLTGRKREFQLYPLSFAEMVGHHGLLTEKRLLPHRLIYGYYPAVVTANGDEKVTLKELADSYLYKDILRFGIIKKSEKITKLLQALAYQIGSQVSYNELAQLVGIDSKTVESYITILEKSYIIFRLNCFSRNLINELKSTRKIYFYDNGIRNALIANFAQPEMRADMGCLWENFIISERIKRNTYQNVWANKYFWRTKYQQEIDYIEESDGKLYAYEFKYNTNKKVNMPKSFSESYPDATFQIITPDNIEDFVL
ncbi:MAG: ATP-binding protein [Paludibacteraceae bacterium]|nr:ATP-binding protein [Paludibacteraceae bacterium]